MVAIARRSHVHMFTIKGRGESEYEGDAIHPNGKILSESGQYYLPRTDIPVDKSSQDDVKVNVIQRRDLSAKSWLRQFVTNIFQLLKVE